MTRFEEVLLERMTVRRWCVAVVVAAVGFGAAGYFGGREYMAYQFRTAARDAVRQFGDDMTAAGGKLAERMAKLSDDVRRRQGEAERRGGGR